MQKFIVIAASSFAALSAFSSGASADDQRLHAALKRIEALEVKITHLSEMEAENTRLKARVKKLEGKNNRSAPTSVIADRMLSTGPIASPAVELLNSTKPSQHRGNSEGDWSGVYVGINAGYGIGEVISRSFTADAGPLTLNGAGPLIGKLSNSFMLNGPTVGAQIGYNYEFTNKLIAGAETDFDFTDFNNKLSAGNGNTNFQQIIIGQGFNQTEFKSDRTGIDWLGTTRLRLGYSLGDFMPYIMGGLAYGALSSELILGNISSNCCGNSSIIQQYGQGKSRNSSSVQLGWIAGAGGELKVSDAWSIRGEYVYTELGSIAAQSKSSSFLNFTQIYSSDGFGFEQSNIGPFGIHQVRFGLNYHTGWFNGDSFALQ